MYIHENFRRIAWLVLWIPFSMCIGAMNATGETVKQAEAVAVADFWYAAEINAEHTRMDAKEKADRLANMRLHEVLFYNSKNELSGTQPEKGKERTLAIVVKFKPAGYVVVSGDDRITPVLAFSTMSPFRFDRPDLNFMPFYLKSTLQWQWKALQEQIDKGAGPPVHERWTELRSLIRGCKDPKEASFGETGRGSRTYVLWDTPLWHQVDPYNDAAKANNGGYDVPTGCVATAMAIKMRYHEWPNSGTGSHSYDDEEGSIQYSHSVDFGAHSFDWSAMPTEVLDPAQSYPEVADLMYFCGVSVEMNYELSESTADTSDAPGAMQNYFRYWGFVWNTSSHEPDLINSIQGGIPALMKWPGHAMVADGYRDTGGPFFHVNLGWNGGSNGWYDLGNVLGHEIAGTGPYGQPQSWVYVNPNYAGTEVGLLRYPFNTLGEGNQYVPSGGQLWLHGATYTGTGNVPIVFNKAMEIKPYNGVVVIQ